MSLWYCKTFNCFST